MTEKRLSPAMLSALQAVARMKGDSAIALAHVSAEPTHDARYRPKSEPQQATEVAESELIARQCHYCFITASRSLSEEGAHLMSGTTFPLEPEEQELLDQIRFDVLAIANPNTFRENGEKISTLTKMLMARSAIPEVRAKHFNDPDYFVGGRGKSRRQIFEGNGTKGEEILKHGNFVKYFRYFLFGPDLPRAVIDNFEARVASCGHVSSSDIIPLGDYARQLARSISAEPGNLADEFYKLALECGIWPSYAEMICKSVKEAKAKPSRTR